MDSSTASHQLPTDFQLWLFAVPVAWQLNQVADRPKRFRVLSASCCANIKSGAHFKIGQATSRAESKKSVSFCQSR